ncbi:TrmH family RNA methyltransferase [Microbacterium keratanolyticum]|uniref:TrmH family RNA methyltransferase n=1 Tax=Microbacterium keratanolyticum TaxID=67574 RepID=UPI00363260DD
MPVVTIEDPDDSRLDDFRNLTDTALRLRSEHVDGLYMAESTKVIARAVAAGHRPRVVMVQERRLADVREIVTDPQVLIAVVPDAVAEAVTGFDVHRGALASMQRPALPSITQVTQGARLILILEDLIEHQNVGAAFRAAAALGADAVLISARCADPLYRRSVRVSMGTVFQVPWSRFTSWQQLRDELPMVQIAALALREDAVTLEEYAPQRADRVALALGTEGNGLSAEALDTADVVVTIPMYGGVDSLNVASAGAVALWALRHPPAP